MMYQNILYTSTFILGLMIIVACQGSSENTQKEKDVDFSTSDASELFFNNVRQIHYDLENQENTQLKIYRIKTRSKDQNHPNINLALVNNWRYDEAYLLIELEGSLKEKSEIEIQWQNTNSEKSGTYTFNVRSNKSDHLKFAGQLYESIMQNHQLHHLHRGETLPILHSKQEREAF